MSPGATEELTQPRTGPTWTNWAGNQTATPSGVARPRSSDEDRTFANDDLDRVLGS